MESLYSYTNDYEKKYLVHTTIQDLQDVFCKSYFWFVRLMLLQSESLGLPFACWSCLYVHRCHQGDGKAIGVSKTRIPW